MNINELEIEIARLETLSREYRQPVIEAFRQSLSSPGSAPYPRPDPGREMNEAAEKQRLASDFPAERDAFLDRLCPAYLSASPQERELFRDAFSNQRSLLSDLLGYVYGAAEKIRSRADVQHLRLGLAAASIENCAVDFRDVLLALAEIYVVAENAGIDPRIYFAEVADLSASTRPRGGLTPVAELLSNFHEYTVLRERRNRRP